MATRTKENLEKLKETYTNNNRWKEIPKDEFFNTYGKKDIIYNIEDPYLFPYVGNFKTRRGDIIAKTIPQTLYTDETKYYILK